MFPKLLSWGRYCSKKQLLRAKRVFLAAGMYLNNTTGSMKTKCWEGPGPAIIHPVLGRGISKLPFFLCMFKLPTELISCLYFYKYRAQITKCLIYCAQAVARI